MAGRKKDAVWRYFSEEPTISGKGVKAKCLNCGKVIMGIVARMKIHHEVCLIDHEEIEDVDGAVEPSASTSIQSEVVSLPSTSRQTAKSTETKGIKRKMITSANQSDMNISPLKKGMDAFVIKTSRSEKNILDEQVAKFIYGTNSAFRTVEHPEFKKMVELLRPGYTPPNQVEIGGALLDKAYETENKNCMKVLNGLSVSMSLDGWSNIHNEPIICCTVTTAAGGVYLIDTIDTSGHSHNAEYLVEVAQSSLQKCKNSYQCDVSSIVTDNTSNVKKMRADMESKFEELITYGCSAHLLNLLAHDLEIPNVKEQIVDVVKYFRNNHFISAKYKQAGGSKLVLPNDVRWNTMVDCLASYIKNWPIMIKVCEENRDEIDMNRYNKVSHIGLKRNAEDLMKVLKPIAIALDIIQRDNCVISHAVSVWKNLESALKDDRLADMKKFVIRYSQALGPAHFLAYLLDPRYCGSNLTAAEKSSALNFAKEKYSSMSILPMIIKFQAKTDPFINILFEEDVVSQVTPLDWWKTHITFDNVAMKKCVQQLFTATAATASVERIFSTFGLVQSKLRNRLGIEKASKLVFLYKAFNQIP